MEVFEPFRKALYAGIGLPEKLKEVVDDLVKRGEMSEGQATKLVKEVGKKVDKGSAEMNKSFAELIAKTMEKMNMPTREEVESLRKEVRALAKKVRETEGR